MVGGLLMEYQDWFELCVHLVFAQGHQKHHCSALAHSRLVLSLTLLISEFLLYYI